MLLFCPTCSNILTVSQTALTAANADRKNRLECLTCPYQFLIERTYFERREFVHEKRDDDIFGGSGQWDNAQKTTAQCPREGCNGNEAAFYQVQIRSADEPMTSFYRCMTCANHWREN